MAMSAHQHSDPTVTDLLRAMWRYRRRWIVGAIVIWGVAAAYIAFASRPWEASQGVLLQRDALTSFDPTSKFENEQARKSSQETILQLSLSRSLLRNTLIEVGPPAKEGELAVWHVVWPGSKQETQAWPSDKAVEALREVLAVTPPKGAEFGKSDVFYVKIKDQDRQRALALVSAFYAELEKAYGRLRETVARNTLRELTETVALAEKSLNEAIERMKKIEQSVGQDLVALRMLDQHPNNEVSLYRNLGNTVDELRQVRMQEAQHATTLRLLHETRDNPHSLQAGSRELVEAHPSLTRLVEGLSAARLKSAAVASRLTEAAPEMETARREEMQVRQEIQRELLFAIQGVQASQELAASRRQTLEKQVAELQERVERINEVRAEYANVVHQVEHLRTLLEEAQRSLALTKAAQTSATQTSLLSPIDDPDGGVWPAGPGRKSLALVGLIAGLVGGSGLVLLTAPITPPPIRPAARQARQRPSTPGNHRHLSPARLAENVDNGHEVRHRVGV